MYCRVCGDSRNVRFYSSKRQALCAACAKETPAKVGREAFDRQYWGGEAGTVPEAIKREFYSDYVASTHDLPDYIEHTASAVL